MKVVGEGVNVKFRAFQGGGRELPKLNKCEQGRTGSKLLAFSDNVLTD